MSDHCGSPGQDIIGGARLVTWSWLNRELAHQP